MKLRSQLLLFLFVDMKMLCPAFMNISGMVWYEVRLIALLCSGLRLPEHVAKKCPQNQVELGFC